MKISFDAEKREAMMDAAHSTITQAVSLNAYGGRPHPDMVDNAFRVLTLINNFERRSLERGQSPAEIADPKEDTPDGP